MRGTLLRELDLVPERVERRDPRISHHDATLASECLDGLEAARELVRGPVERERGMHTRAAAEIDDREEQVAQLVLQMRLRARGAGRRNVILRRKLAAHLGQLLLHLSRGTFRVVPVEAHAGGALLQPVGAMQRWQRGIAIGDAGIAALDALWNEVKLAE